MPAKRLHFVAFVIVASAGLVLTCPSASAQTDSMPLPRDPAAELGFAQWLQTVQGGVVTDPPAATAENEKNVDAENAPTDARFRETMTQWKELRKPIDEIGVQMGEPGEVVPESLAAFFSPDEPVRLITSLGIGVPIPLRYTIPQPHRPLYYEQPLLERCGRGHGCLQNGISGLQFFATTLLLPYKMTAQCPDCLVDDGGDCRACEPYPVDCGLLPVDRHALVSQAAAIAGFTFLLL